MTQRVLTSLVGLVLLGVLAWLLWPPPKGQTHIVAIPIWAYDHLAVPPIAAAFEDLRQLQTTVPSDRFDNWKELQEAGSLADLEGRLQPLTKTRQDVLILYVSGHGISEDGAAYLLCSDFLRTPRSGRHKISDLLRHLQSSPAGLKLIVLDTGRIGSDPRLGMVVNEFPRLVERQLQELAGDESVWVLLSNSVFQTTNVGNSQRRSVFGQSVAEALSGKADLVEEGGDGQLKVSLSELYDYVAKRSADWFDSDSGAAQTPLLMQAGRGLVMHGDVPPDLYLVTLEPPSGKSSSDKAPADQPETDDRDGAASSEARRPPRVQFAPAGLALWQPGNAAGDPPTDEPSAEDAPPKDPANAEASEDQPKPDAIRPAPPAEAADRQPQTETVDDKEMPFAGLRSKLDEAWRLRDRLQNRQSPGGWSPVDVAPHLWRELCALLLDYELRCRAGEAFDAEGLDLNMLTTLTEGMDRFERLVAQGGLPPPRRADETSVVDRLTDAWRGFINERTARDSFTNAPADLNEAKTAVRFSRDLVFLAPYYVRWHERASLTSTSPVSQYSDISSLLDQLDGLQQLVRQLAGRPLTATDRQELAARRTDLEQIQQRIDRGLRQSGQRFADAIDEPINERRIVDLLGTPLLSTEARKALFDKLLEAGREAPQRVTLQPPEPPKNFSGTVAQRARLAERIDLEMKLVRLVDPDRADQIAQSVSQLTGGRSSAAGGQDALWQQYRAIGMELKSFYAGLPGRIDKQVAGGQPADETRSSEAERLLQIVDARDSRQVPARAQFFSRLRILPPSRPDKLLVEISPSEELALKTDSWLSFDVRIQATGRSLREATVQLDYDADLLEVRTDGEENTVGSGKPRSVALGSDGAATLRYQIRASRDPGGTVQLAAHVQAGRLRQRRAIGCRLPRPNEIDLIVEHDGSRRRWRSDGEHIRLRPFPNRQTAFRFMLENRSGEAKTVNVELLAVPSQPRAKWAPGRLRAAGGGLNRGIGTSVFDAAGRRRPNVKVLAATPQPVGVPADGSLVEIVFAPPGAQKKDDPQAAPPAGATVGGDSAGNAQGAPADVSYGLVCLMSSTADGDGNNERWIKWIELSPLAPKDYLDPTVGYDIRTERITVRLTAKDMNNDGRPDPDRALPAGIDQQPITVLWHTAGEIPDGAEQNDRDALDGRRQVAELYAVVKPDGKDRIVRLTVDGYPRAFIYQVTCTGGAAALALKPSLEQVRITALSVPGHPRGFYVPPAIPPPVPPAAGGKPPEKVFIELAPGQRAAFPAPCPGIVVNFQVDAPEDAFQLDDRDDVIELALDAVRDDRRSLYADRQVVTRLVPLDDSGLVTLTTQVGDYTLTLHPRGLQNRNVTVRVQLILAGSVVQSDPVGVVLDGQQPQIRGLRTEPAAGKSVAQGTRIAAHLEVNDLSGVEQVQAGFDLNQLEGLQADEVLADKKLAQPPFNNIWSLDVETKDLKIGSKRLIVTATDRVGLSSATSQEFTIGPPAADDGDAKAGQGTISGVVAVGTLRPDGVTVTIEKSGLPPQRTRDGGKFFFKDVPAGSYTLLAEGTIQNRIRRGKLEEVEPAPPKKPKPLVIPLK